MTATPDQVEQWIKRKDLGYNRAFNAAQAYVELSKRYKATKEALDSSLQTNQALCKKLQGAKKELRELIDWALELEKELDLQHGLGDDAGSGCSTHILKATKWLQDNSNRPTGE